MSQLNLWTTGQIAKALGIGPDTVRDWANRNKLQATRIPGGRRRRVSRDALVAFLSEQPDADYHIRLVEEYEQRHQKKVTP